MTRPSRRTVLSSTAGLLALSAGCLADDTGESPDAGDDDTDGDPGSTGNEDDAESTGDETDSLSGDLVDYETQAYQYPTGESTSTVDVVRDADEATQWLETRSLSGVDPLAGFVDGTDFETSILVSLESEAPNSCYELVLESIDTRPIEDGEGGEADGSGDESSPDDGTDGDATDGSDDSSEELVLKGEAKDTSADDEACTMAITTVGRLVRATFESEPPTALSATVVDHEGNTSGVSMRSDSASASESTSVGSGSGDDASSDGGS